MFDFQTCALMHCANFCAHKKLNYKYNKADMAVVEFPDPNLANEDGLLAFGGDLEVETLKKAYFQGIFPWPMEGLPLPWFSPPSRAVILFDQIRINRSARRGIRSTSEPATQIHLTLNQDFQNVIQYCAQSKRPGQKGTWITSAMKKAYIRAHLAGIAHSIEVWENHDLIGGIYGIETAGAFSAESMFYKKSFSSKLALLALIDLMKSQGATWLDIQVMTPHMKSLGAIEIPRNEFLEKLHQTHDQFSQGRFQLDWRPRSLPFPSLEKI